MENIIEKKGVTVQDLINELSKVEDKTLAVHLEGCDCYQDWNGSISIDETNYLLLTNSDN